MGWNWFLSFFFSSKMKILDEESIVNGWFPWPQMALADTSGSSKWRRPRGRTVFCFFFYFVSKDNGGSEDVRGHRNAARTWMKRGGWCKTQIKRRGLDQKTKIKTKQKRTKEKNRSGGRARSSVTTVTDVEVGCCLSFLFLFSPSIFLQKYSQVGTAIAAHVRCGACVSWLQTAESLATLFFEALFFIPFSGSLINPFLSSLRWVEAKQNNAAKSRSIQGKKKHPNRTIT